MYAKGTVVKTYTYNLIIGTLHERKTLNQTQRQTAEHCYASVTQIISSVGQRHSFLQQRQYMFKIGLAMK